MDRVTVKNFRCFREKQTARLAPLTLLVGENSAGKTSFLALLRALWEIAYNLRIPDFKEAPYDLGSFDEIVHRRGGRADSFEAGFSVDSNGNVDRQPESYEFTFEKSGTAPVPVRRYRTSGDDWIEECYRAGHPVLIQAGTRNGSWKGELSIEAVARLPSYGDRMWPFFLAAMLFSRDVSEDKDFHIEPLNGSPDLTKEDAERLRRVSITSYHYMETSVFASAPVRSKPKRTYDPSRPTPDPEGDYVPMYLANLFSQDSKKWDFLKSLLEKYGKAAGLFDEISIRRLGRRDSEPFQIQVRKYSGRMKGPYHNLTDVGYGISQVLPILTELLRDDVSPMFLLQQPEVHLHPSAQAALGSLFCQIASPRRQLVVETHSDHLMDRVRMDVRDGVAGLKPSDVSILFFERNRLDVKIHSLGVDEEGNIVGAPDGYRNFFMEEVARSLWKNYGQEVG